MSAIEEAFNRTPALMPYLTLGYPTVEESLACVQAAAEAGADLIELGVPFSDPLADGPVIQHSTQTAIDNGVTLAACLDMSAELRRRGVRVPFLFMGYYNPIHSFGVERFADEAALSGVNGVIVPDLPLEECDDLARACAGRGLTFIYMLAPTSTPERIRRVTERATGFIYVVSVAGITGERATLPDGLRQFVGRVRQTARAKVAVGFGISTPEQARAVGQLADGVIIGTAVVRAAGGKHPAEGVRVYLQSIRRALEQSG